MQTILKDKVAVAWPKRAEQHMLLPNQTSLENVGAMAAFMASDKASATTGTIANMSAGMVLS